MNEGANDLRIHIHNIDYIFIGWAIPKAEQPQYQQPTTKNQSSNIKYI